MELHGQVLCEDCYMDLLSPAKACDPWAVYSAKTFLKNDSSGPNLTPVQQRILEILQDEDAASGSRPPAVVLVGKVRQEGRGAFDKDERIEVIGENLDLPALL